MKLSLHKEYLSITSFNSVELPDFTVITGPNGSGKTHLLQSIENGSMFIDGASMKIAGKAKFFDATTIVPKSTGAFKSQSLETSRKAEIQKFTRFKTQLRNNLNNHLKGQMNVVRQSTPDFDLADPFNLMDIDFESGSLYNESQLLQLNQLKKLAENYVANNTNQGSLASTVSNEIYEFAEANKIPIYRLTEEDLTIAVIGWGSVNAFQQNLGQLFVAYRDMRVKNDLKSISKQRNRRSDIRILSDNEFLDNYGQSPWDFVNAILHKAQIPFSINAPELESYSDFLPILTKITNGAKIPFESLSSGEKVLMSFALCLYQARDKRQTTTYPEFLLFDEIDAPLHPSMVKDLIATIKDILVAEKKVKVILTTHSPTTVALAPEESVFVMRDSCSLEKSSKEAALRLLTYGVPTLSINFDSRRQVLAESRLDAGYYEEIYKLLRPNIQSEKSLLFIAASGAQPNEVVPSENGGSSVVSKLTDQLCDAGNTSIYGLIDWDTKNKSRSRLHVLAEGNRYSLDTCLIDPADSSTKCAALD